MGAVSHRPDSENPAHPTAPGAAGGAEPRYKIGDVCRIADVQPYVLRYWESEFPALAPDRTATGPRTYSVRELRIIEQIKKLLYDEGYTIAGAKKKLDAEPGGKEPEAAPAPAPPKSKDREARGKGARAGPEMTELPFPDTPVLAQTAPIRVSAAPPPSDPRVPKAVAELKEILKILSRRS
jgi:DNA-binding transcriptional MerR regulator